MSHAIEPDRPAGSSPGGGTALLEHTEERVAADTPWQVLLHNDPVNLTGYVTRVLIKVLECTEEDAERYMMIAHTMGKAAVYAGTQAECEAIATRLGNHSLWATMEKASS